MKFSKSLISKSEISFPFRAPLAPFDYRYPYLNFEHYVLLTNDFQTFRKILILHFTTNPGSLYSKENNSLGQRKWPASTPEVKKLWTAVDLFCRLYRVVSHLLIWSFVQWFKQWCYMQSPHEVEWFVYYVRL